MHEHWRQHLRAAVKAHAKAAATSQAAIAKHAGIPAESLSRILNGTIRNPGFTTVVRIAHAAQETVASLVGERTLSAHDEATLLHVLYEVRQATNRLIKLLESRMDQGPGEMQ